jgi:transposase
MKKISTVGTQQSKNFREQKLTIGLDLGDRTSWYCVLDEAGDVLLEQKLGTIPKAMKEVFGKMPRSRIALETGMHSPWVSQVLSELGHEVIVAHARNVRLIGESRRKDDRFDARTLARLARIDPQLLSPVQHRSAQSQSHLMVIRARAGLVRVRTSLINTARGLTKSYGERLRGCSPRNLNAEKARQLSPELQAALEPLLAAIESMSQRIYEYNQQIAKIAKESYPQVARLEQVKGVGTLIALTYLLTLKDPQRFRKSRDVGCYVGLQPGRRNSGQSEPQLHISKEGDPYLRALLVQGAHHILGPFGADSDLRRWGLKLAERGGKNGKKRAVVATARKLAVLLHRLWVNGEAYQPLRNSDQSCCRQPHSSDLLSGKHRAPMPSSGDCVYGLAQLPSRDGRRGRQTGGSTGCNENTQLAPSAANAHQRVRMEGWRQGWLGCEARTEERRKDQPSGATAPFPS